MGKPDFVVIRHVDEVYLIPKGNLGKPLLRDEDDNDAIIDRTYSSSFLDGLAFAGGFANSA